MSVIVEPGRTFLDNSGRVLSSGTVTFYVAGQTVTKIAIYPTAADQLAATNALSNPQTLTSAGRLTTQVHAAGPCRMIVKNSLGATILDEDNVLTTDYTALTAAILGLLLRPRTTAEINAGVTPTYYYYDPGYVQRYGAVSAATNVTTAFAAAALVSAYHETVIPPGTWNISGVTFTSGARVRTAGFSTVLTQIAGYDGSPNTLTRLVKITGSNVVFAQEGVKVVGQIATDSGEFNHGVCVETSGADIANVTIGDIQGVDIRGDVLYIGGTSGNTVKNVRYGRISGANILRNVVAITDGVYDVKGVAAIQDGAVGYAVYDIEPDNAPARNIRLDLVRGRKCQVAPTLAADYADGIYIGTLELDPTYGGNTTPTYSAYDGNSGLTIRNTRMLEIGYAKITNFPYFAMEQIFNLGELADQRLHIGHLEISGCGASESTYNTACLLTNMTYVKVDSFKIALQAVGDYGFYGNAATQFDLSNGTIDGTLVRFADASTFSRLSVNTANAAPLFRDVTNSTVQDSNLTIPTLINNATNVTFQRVDGTHSTAILAGTVADVTFENCSGGLEGVSSPAQITASQNDYAVGQAVTDLRISTDVSRNVTGITNGRKGRVMRVFNVGSFDLVLVNGSASSAAANRFALGADLTINAGEGATLWYDSVTSFWRCASRV